MIKGLLIFLGIMTLIIAYLTHKINLTSEIRKMNKENERKVANKKKEL